jgi:hypothetical protein
MLRFVELCREVTEKILPDLLSYHALYSSFDFIP